MRRRALLVAAAGVIGAACLPRGLRTPTAWRSDGPAAPGSPLAARPSAGYWPDAVKQAPAVTQRAYEYAAANERTLRYIPCYCGCAGQGHKDNFDCYVSEIRGDGWVILDAHALG